MESVWEKESEAEAVLEPVAETVVVVDPVCVTVTESLVIVAVSVTETVALEDLEYD